ncbi:MAG: tetratricopeptide repeat protein, partial [Deltaproteobacteria bacterium]
MQRALGSVLVILLIYVLPMPAHGGEGGGAYFDLGVFDYEDGDYESAEMHFKRAAEFNPSNPFYNHFLGKTYLRTARYEEAMGSLTKAWESDPNITGLKYDLALLNYKMSEFHRAASLFAEVAEEDPSNILAHYQAGISYYAEKGYRRALDYFLTAAEKSPTVRGNGYYYAGVCYWKMGDIEKAVEKFSFVRDHADSQLLRENAVVWLRRVEQDKVAVKPYTVSLKVGLHYDDNVPPEPEDQDLYSDEDDFVTKVYFTGKYNVINRKDYQIGAGYNHYHTLHNDWEEYDLIGSVFNIFGKYRLRQATFGLSYLPSYYWLDSDSYLRRHKLMPELIWRFSEDLSTRLSYSYRDDEHFQHDDRDGDAHEVVLEAYYVILDKR